MSEGRAVTLAFQTDKTTDEFARLGMMAEAFGFDGVSMYGDLGYQPPILPLLVIAKHTNHLRLGPACLNPYLAHPVEIAGQTAALDVASHGRAYLGLARGAWLDRVGVCQTRPLRTLREAIDVVRLLYSGAGCGYEGEVFRIAPGTRLRHRTSGGKLEVLLGTWGRAGAALAAGIADELKIGGTANPDMARLMRGWLDDACDRAERRSDAVGLVVGAVTVVDEDRAAARARARTEVAMYLDVVAPLDRTVEVPPDLLVRIGALVGAGAHDEAGRLIPDDLLDRFSFAGSPDDVAARALALYEAGATRVEFGTPHGSSDERGVELLGTRVLPVLREAIG